MILSVVLSIFLACVVTGALVGFLAGLLGIGGGLVIVPVLSMLLGYFQVVPAEQAFLVAVATSLASIVVTSISSARAHHANQNVPWNIALYVVIGVSIGAGVSSFWAESLGSTVLQWIFLITVLFVGMRMAMGSKPGMTDDKEEVNGGLVVFLTTIIGGLSSLIGIGGGALTVPLLSALSINVKRAIGCSAVAGGFISVMGSVGYIVSGWSEKSIDEGFVGYIYLPALIGIISASALTAPLGANAAHRLPVAKLKRIFAVFLFVMAAKVLHGLL